MKSGGRYHGVQSHAEVQEKFQIRTDLALEAREALTEDGRQTSGIVLEEWEEAGGEVRLSRVTVENSRGARTIGKPKGVYLTMEADALWKNDGGIHREIAEVLAEQILWFFARMEISPDASVLTAGLGNPGDDVRFSGAAGGRKSVYYEKSEKSRARERDCAGRDGADRDGGDRDYPWGCEGDPSGCAACD